MPTATNLGKGNAVRKRTRVSIHDFSSQQKRNKVAEQSRCSIVFGMSQGNLLCSLK